MIVVAGQRPGADRDARIVRVGRADQMIDGEPQSKLRLCIALDLDVAMRIDPEDRKDAELLLRAEGLELNRKAPTEQQINIIASTPSPVQTVRGLDGVAQLMTCPFRSAPLILVGDGALPVVRAAIAAISCK